MTTWKVTLQADGDRLGRIIVSAPDEDTAARYACDIELAPRRSVLTVEPYGEEI